MKTANRSRIIVIANVPFAIDSENRTFRQWDNHNNEIAFDDLKEEDNYFSTLFDKERKNLADGMYESGKLPAEIIPVIIPSVIVDGSELDEELVKAINENAKESNWGIFVTGEDVANRLSGILPHIDLAGIDYIVDWRLKALRETDAPQNWISLKNMDMSPSGDDYLCFFDTESHEVYTPEYGITALPEHVVLLIIPNEIRLDPVATARQYGIGDIDLLLEHPLQMKLAAIVRPLSETGLPAMIEENPRNKDIDV